MGRVEGKVALITGAGSGLGRASAIHLAEEGAYVIATDLNQFSAAATEKEINSFLNPCLDGNDIALISDAGCPGIADPGSQIVRLAHENEIKVIPLVGPSSILLALMGSGMNGQNFKFNGYLSLIHI